MVQLYGSSIMIIHKNIDKFFRLKIKGKEYIKVRFLIIILISKNKEIGLNYKLVKITKM